MNSTSKLFSINNNASIPVVSSNNNESSQPKTKEISETQYQLGQSFKNFKKIAYGAPSWDENQKIVVSKDDKYKFEVVKRGSTTSDVSKIAWGISYAFFGVGLLVRAGKYAISASENRKMNKAVIERLMYIAKDADKYENVDKYKKKEFSNLMKGLETQLAKSEAMTISLARSYCQKCTGVLVELEQELTELLHKPSQLIDNNPESKEVDFDLLVDKQMEKLKKLEKQQAEEKELLGTNEEPKVNERQKKRL